MSEYQYITNWLNIEGAIIKKVVVSDERITITVEMPRKVHACPVCHTNTDIVHDYRIQKVHALPIQEKDCWLLVRKRRYTCPHCGKSFSEDIPFLARYQRMTNSFRYYMLSRFHETVTIKHIARELFISPTTAGNVFKRFVNYPRPQLPECIAIDQFKGNADGKKFQCILADPQNKKVLDILIERKQDDLCRYFLQFSHDERATVKYVVMDMDTLFRSVIKSCFPHAEIVVDKFHVCRLVTCAMENIRKQVQKQFGPQRRKYFKKSRWILLKRQRDLTKEEKEQLIIMLRVSNELREAYLMKELFYQMMESANEGEARQRYKQWEKAVLASQSPEFNKVLETCSKWYKEILAAFKVPYTNGYIEGCNNKSKVLKRISFGLFDFDMLRNRRLCIANA